MLRWQWRRRIWPLRHIARLVDLHLLIRPILVLPLVGHMTPLISLLRSTDDWYFESKQRVKRLRGFGGGGGCEIVYSVYL